jgi:hypothetical protein
VTYCDVQGGWPGLTNINEQPYLDFDFHLTRRSCCINMGDNSASTFEDIEGESRPFMGTMDIGADEYTGVHRLGATAFSFDSWVGCNISLPMNAGPAGAGRSYIVIGTNLGKYPGIPLPAGGGMIYITLSPFTWLLWGIAPTFTGELDSSGKPIEVPRLELPPVPFAAGMTLSFVYVLTGPVDYASNPVDISIL